MIVSSVNNMKATVVTLGSCHFVVVLILIIVRMAFATF